MDVSNNAHNFDPEQVREACGMYAKITNGRFVLGLCTLRYFMICLYYLSKELQHVNINGLDVEAEIKRAKKNMEKITTEAVFQDATSYSEKTLVPLILIKH